MPQGVQSRGRCMYCDGIYTKGGMARHLASCPARKAAGADAPAERAVEPLYHLRVQDAGRGDFWLDLEVRGAGKLEHLDRYLRAIWLECCGHLSEFTLEPWTGPTIAKRRRIQEVFEPGFELTHIYDFGSTSYTLIRCLSVREGRFLDTRHYIELMARNLAPRYKCIECGGPAKWLCMECLIEDNIWGALCSKHAASHPHQNYGEPFPMVNSPRLGMCGYTGPAEPPY
jgi:hypothetical protein